ncbi:SGNH/GDSL hydrolase family protein [Rhodopirellula sallentina]|uniref:Putative secreted protein n=1 Tax=Rhodopirellula sallentina SM41 TaxID=1263870 RepID=M5U0R1_9BACT|nr:SGNH/GDSL hydrolase family protein [Rhodopirellula sallentina]EMI55040.1 putative secreted protein [Rhodopirellula sallentina SM41]
MSYALRRSTVSICLVLCLATHTFGDSDVASSSAKAKPADAEAKPAGNASRPTWATEADPSLPNVLILGDSISIGYGLPLKQRLQGVANVYRPLAANQKRPQNCGGTTQSLQRIDDWLATNQWDLIHFNWGLHDLKHVTQAGGLTNSKSPDDPAQAAPKQYGENLKKLVAKLKATGAKLIFATTTPIVADSSGPYRAKESPAIYNEVAVSIMNQHGIEVNDLYAACDGKLDELQLPKNVHFKKAGSEYLADVVAAKIKKALTE